MFFQACMKRYTARENSQILQANGESLVPGGDRRAGNGLHTCISMLGENWNFIMGFQNVGELFSSLCRLGARA